MQVRQLLTRTAGALGVTAGLLFVGSPLMAQVKIGDNPNTINPSSILELESASKALLLPRVPLQALGTKAPVTNAVAGMHVYNTTENAEVQPGEYFFDGSTWVRLNSNDTYNYIEGSGAPSGSCPAKTIYTDNDDLSGTFGQQWTCINGAWVVYKSPTKTPFFAGDPTNQNDAGGAKRGPITRYGHIITQRETPAGQGKATLAPGGLLQLLRGTGIDPTYGASIDFSTVSSNQFQYRIGIRNDIQNGALVFHQTPNGTTQPLPRMMLTPAGKLGLGTISVDASNLAHFVGTLQGSAVTTTPAQLGGTSSTAGYRLFYDNDNNAAQLVINSGSNAATPNTNLSNLVLVKRTGNAGEIYAEFIANSTTVGSIERVAGGVAYNQTSDRRLKENIKSTRFTIDDLMKVGVVDYNYKSDASKTTTTGFIAQDLFKVFPDAVTKGGDDVTKKPWMVDYSKVTPLLVKAIQDQQKEIAALKTQLSEMNALKAEVASIKAMLGNTEQQKSETTISK